jgi:hypothetical protein
MIDRSAQAAMVIVLERDETKGLQHTGGRSPHRAENLRHAVDWPRLRLKGEFHERAGSQRLLQLQQSTSHGNALEFCSCTPAIF